ncbi:MAG: DUF116 domain-containing protein [Candidatus Bathyarchaeota archaeon]|nr:DUF116 domain-containing protein [Candidatus Bathyarchaeota archaeon]
MPYRFSFDLSRIPKSFFRELASVTSEKGLHRKFGNKARHLAEKFRIQEITGLDVSDALMLVEDLVDIYVRNVSESQNFHKTKKRALLLPHCARKHMDNRCQARFNPEIPSYSCGHCSEDCIVNKATNLAEKKGYDVFVLAGSSCVPQILKKSGYEGVIGVACSHELKMGGDYLQHLGLTGQAIPLTKNGCANTEFSLDTLKKTMDQTSASVLEA